MMSLNPPVEEKNDDLGDYLNQVVPHMCESLYTSHENFFKDQLSVMNASKSHFFENS